MTPRHRLLALGLAASLGLTGWLASQPDAGADADADAAAAAAALLPPPTVVRAAGNSSRTQPAGASLRPVSGPPSNPPSNLPSDPPSDPRTDPRTDPLTDPSSDLTAGASSDPATARAQASAATTRRQPWPVPDSAALQAWQPLPRRPAALAAAAGSVRAAWPATAASAALAASASDAAASAPPNPPPNPSPERPAPLPFTLVGGLDDGSGAIAWLATPQRTLAVRAGDSLPGGWRVDAVAAGQVDITRLGGSDRRSLRYPTP